MWIRTCQECGHKQQDKNPRDYQNLPVSWTDRKCKECKSPALDYGKETD